jgi:hypothetical protein
MILALESGAQEDQFDGKKEGQKSCGTIPLSRPHQTNINSLFLKHQMHFKLLLLTGPSLAHLFYL